MVSPKLVAASSVPLVLAILAQGESYGYSILQRVRAESGGALAWTEGMLYPVLHRLERDGLLEAEWRAADTGRRRKYYRLAERGRAALVEEREQWERVHRTLDRLWEAGDARA